MDKIIIITLLIKVLLIPAYFTTDFEVHRNWLRITNNINIKEWYFDTFSEWTLNHFSHILRKILSYLAKLVDLFMVGE